MDKREYIRDDEEALRASFAGLMRSMAFAMPCVMSEDTQDGHRCSPQPSIQRAVTDPVTGDITYVDHPIAVDAPIHFAGGKRVVATHPVGQGDEGIIVYADRALDVPMQQSGTGQPIDDRQHHLGDGMYVPGIRSDPRKLMQVDNDAHHVRDVDKKHVRETHPDNGHRTFSADPSTAPASANFDPLSMATKFFAHLLHPTNGILGQATDGGTTHSHGVTHTDGAFMSALNGEHVVRAHPAIGALLSALNGQHIVQAHPEQGVMVQSQTAVQIASQGPLSLSAPPGMLSLPSGGVSSGALAQGAASANVGQLGGDLAGTLPNPQVISVLNVSNANLLPNAANDAAAAALVPPVQVGHFYRNGSVVMVRVA